MGGTPCPTPWSKLSVTEEFLGFFSGLLYLASHICLISVHFSNLATGPQISKELMTRHLRPNSQRELAKPYKSETHATKALAAERKFMAREAGLASAVLFPGRDCRLYTALRQSSVSASSDRSGMGRCSCPTLQDGSFSRFIQNSIKASSYRGPACKPSSYWNYEGDGRIIILRP